VSKASATLHDKRGQRAVLNVELIEDADIDRVRTQL
jgi:hypothetical protein